MQFPGKLKNQTWKNYKKPNFGPDFGLSGPNLAPTNFFVGFPSDIIHCCKLSFYAISVKTNKPN